MVGYKFCIDRKSIVEAKVYPEFDGLYLHPIRGDFEQHIVDFFQRKCPLLAQSGLFHNALICTLNEGKEKYRTLLPALMVS